MRLGKRQHVSCERVTQWISLELDDELAETERFALERHLGGCADCRARRAELETIATLLRTAPVLAPEAFHWTAKRMPETSFVCSRKRAWYASRS